MQGGTNEIQNYQHGDPLDFFVTGQHGELSGQASLSSTQFYPHGFDAEMTLTCPARGITGLLRAKIVVVDPPQLSSNNPSHREPYAAGYRGGHGVQQMNGSFRERIGMSEVETIDRSGGAGYPEGYLSMMEPQQSVEMSGRRSSLTEDPRMQGFGRMDSGVSSLREGFGRRDSLAFSSAGSVSPFGRAMTNARSNRPASDVMSSYSEVDNFRQPSMRPGTASQDFGDYGGRRRVSAIPEIPVEFSNSSTRKGDAPGSPRAQLMEQYANEESTPKIKYSPAQTQASLGGAVMQTFQKIASFVSSGSNDRGREPLRTDSKDLSGYEDHHRYNQDRSANYQLKVHIISGHGLRVADWSFTGNGKSDPYCIVYLVDSQGNKKENSQVQTNKLEQTLNPVWNHEIENVPDYDIGDKLYFKVMDWDPWPKPHDDLGFAILGAQEICDGFEGDLLLEEAGDAQGKAKIKVKVESPLHAMGGFA
jgi:hypothetical protein